MRIPDILEDMELFLKDYSKVRNMYSYHLYAMCAHVGDSVDSGHYITYSKNNGDSKCRKYDDHEVSIVECLNLIEHAQFRDKVTPYILFYQRKLNITNIPPIPAVLSTQEFLQNRYSKPVVNFAPFIEGKSSLHLSKISISRIPLIKEKVNEENKQKSGFLK